MIALIGQWSHALAALFFAALAIWQCVRRDRRRAMFALAFAFGLIAAWAGLVAVFGPDSTFARVGETVRNLGLLAFLFTLLQRGSRDERRPFIALIHAALLVVGLLQIALVLTFGSLLASPELSALAYGSTAVLNVLFVIGALLLVHTLYTAAAPEARWGIRFTMIALAAMWGYDLNLYTFAWLGGRAPMELLALRGVLIVALVPSFALAMQRNEDWKMKLSRKVTFRSISLIAIAGYFVLMFLASEAIELFANDYAAIIQAALLFVMSVGAILLLPSPRVRAWLKVKFAKHLFEHRYDYRAEWIRFNSTLARPGENADPLDERVVRAIAEITESAGGLLLVPDGDDRLGGAARWNWPTLDIRQDTDAGLGKWLASSGHIIELEPMRQGTHGNPEEIALLVPDWMIAETRAWAIVPLIHQNRLIGAVLLESPRIERTLDWEDLDLLRIAGRQAASYLAEAKGQEALAEARRFDEFNRRFAFIMHDIKNLVSQLSLVARNAERHADNPEFRADMIATLQDSVGKMNDLLVRLAPQDRGKAEPLRSVDLRKIAGVLAKQKGDAHAINVTADTPCRAIADPARLETALSHIVQNAIDASPADTSVCITVGCNQAEAWIAVEDSGAGMDEAFIRDSLFRPFSSSKTGGFGIGAFEARSLVSEMGGRLDVDSHEGRGTRFTISLPIAPAKANNTELAA